MASLSGLDIFFSIFLILIGIVTLVLIIVLYANRPKVLEENKIDDVNISYFSSLNFIEIDSFQVYNQSSYNLGLTGKIILDCYKGICQYEDYYNKTNLKYCYSEQCSYNINEDCDCEIDGKKIKGKCSRLYDDSYGNGKYCYTENIIYNWKGKKYVPLKKDVLTYYKNAKLKDEECPKGKINCGIIDSNENKLCLSSSSNCPINYFSENKLNSNKIYSTVDIGNKTFYYTYDDNTTMKRKIIAGLVADTDLYLNKDNAEKVIIDTNTISGFLADNKNLYKELNLGYDPYKEENIDNKGNSYLRLFYNNKVDLKELRNNINNYNLNHKINEDAINPIRKNIKLIMIFGLISYISFFIVMLFIITCRSFNITLSFFIFLFMIFYIISFIFICINISKFNKLKNLDENADNFPRIVNLTIFILYIILFVFILFLGIYIIQIREKCKGNSCSIGKKEIEENKNKITTPKISDKIEDKNQNQNDKSAQGLNNSTFDVNGINN